MMSALLGSLLTCMAISIATGVTVLVGSSSLDMPIVRAGTKQSATLKVLLMSLNRSLPTWLLLQPVSGVGSEPWSSQGMHHTAHGSQNTIMVHCTTVNVGSTDTTPPPSIGPRPSLLQWGSV